MKKQLKTIVCGLLTAGCIFASASAPIYAAEMPSQEDVLEVFDYNQSQIDEIKSDQLQMQAQNPIYSLMGLSNTDEVNSVSVASRLVSPFTLIFLIGIVCGIIGFAVKIHESRRERAEHRAEYELQKELVELEKLKFSQGVTNSKPRFVKKATTVQSPFTSSSSAYLSGMQNPADTNCDGIVDDRDFNIPFGC